MYTGTQVQCPAGISGNRHPRNMLNKAQQAFKQLRGRRGGVLDERNTLVDLGLELREHGVEVGLLKGIQLTSAQNLGHAAGAQQHLGCEVRHVGHNLHGSNAGMRGSRQASA